MTSFEADNLGVLYRFFDYTGGLITLKNQKLRFKTADQFNDPYELKPESFIPDFDLSSLGYTEFMSEIRKIQDPYLKPLLEAAMAKVPHHEIENQLRPIIDASVKKYIKEAREHFDNYRRTSYINCLTHRVDDIKMWANYADKGQGISIEFEVSVERDNGFRCAKPVSYLPTVPKLYSSLSNLFMQAGALAKLDGRKEIFDHFSYSKSVDWKDEEEWRIIIPDMGTDTYCDYSFAKEDIKSVYLGYNLENDQEVIAEIKKVNNEIKIFKTQINDKEKGLLFEQIK